MGSWPAAGGGGGGGGGSLTASASPQELAFLFQHNARFLDGHTIRWAGLPIQVHTAGISGAEAEVQNWTGATGGAGGGNGEFTTPVANMIRLLYSLAPGTMVASGQARRGVVFRYRPEGTTMYRVEIEARP